VTPRDKSEQLRNAIAGARMILIRGAGHLSNQEQPVQFNAAVREFLAKVAVKAPAD
jgi:pimeloyl-ACP methyl ester carboxylesterase